MKALRLDDRFITAWKHIEHNLAERWRAANRGDVPDAAALLDWAKREDVLSADVVAFLNRCRSARNAYSHVAFDGYAGPVALPPVEVVQRIERIAGTLRSPCHVGGIARSAVTCQPTTPLIDALGFMRGGDFSQLPFQRAGGWELITRDQIARWLEVQVDTESLALVDCSASVASVADTPGVNKVIPKVLKAVEPLYQAVDELEDSLMTPDDQIGGYAALLIIGAAHPAQPAIVTADDLPRMYDMLGK